MRGETCTKHLDEKHQHALTPPMGAVRRGVVQSWFCCACGAVGQTTTLPAGSSEAAYADGETTLPDHGPFLRVRVAPAKRIRVDKG